MSPCVHHSLGLIRKGRRYGSPVLRTCNLSCSEGKVEEHEGADEFPRHGDQMPSDIFVQVARISGLAPFQVPVSWGRPIAVWTAKRVLHEEVWTAKKEETNVGFVKEVVRGRRLRM